jgi:predicted RNase H-like HicB family nuclease
MAERAMKYHVVVTRDGDGWMADVPALPGTHTWAKTLRALDSNVREVIGMVEDLPRSAEAAVELEMDYRTGDPVLDERAGRLRTRRREQERAAAEIASDTFELLRRFAAQLSVGDAAVLLGVSKGRISQLRGKSAAQSTTAARRTGTNGWASSPAQPPRWSIEPVLSGPMGASCRLKLSCSQGRLKLLPRPV